MGPYLVFSDGHIGEYPEGWVENGLNTRLSDTLEIWDAVTNLALEHDATVLFGGDRFKPKRPPGWMRDLADDRLRRMGEAGIQVVCDLGNHDMWDKAGRFNSYGGAKTWKAARTTIVEKPSTLQFDDLQLIVLPYGATELPKYEKNRVTMVLFHDSIISLSQYHGLTAKEGLPRELLDREDFALVVGGHIHQRQMLPFKHTDACHVGSPLERIEDGNQGEKGCFLINPTRDNLQVKFVPLPAPKVVTMTIDDPDLAVDKVASKAAGNVIQAHLECKLPTGVRKQMLQAVRDSGGRGFDVKRPTPVKVTQSAKSVVLKQGGTMGEQILDWAKAKKIEDTTQEYLTRLVHG